MLEQPGQKKILDGMVSSLLSFACPYLPSLSGCLSSQHVSEVLHPVPLTGQEIQLHIFTSSEIM